MTTRLSELDRGKLAVLLGSLAMLGPFAVDTYLPAFPNIERSLQATSLEVQQTLTAYLFAFAVMMLWHGALSDAYGRRNLILIALSVFAVASLGCAAAHSIEYLWAFRMLQGMSAGAGVVIGRAIIRDLYSGAHATKLLSLVTMIFSIAPAIAPILGGWIVKLRDWRAIFLFLFAYTIFVLWFAFKRLPETLPLAERRPFRPRNLATSYWAVFTSVLFQLKAGCVAFVFAGLFLYVAAAPAFLTNHLGLGPEQFGWQFIPMVGGIFFGALASNRIAGKLQVARHAGIGFAVLAAAGVMNVAYHTYFPPALPWSVIPLFIYSFGMSLVTPVVTLLIIDLFPKMRGLVASCQSFTQTMLATFAAGVLAPALSGSVLLLAAGQLACAIIALALWYAGTSYHDARERRRANAWESVPVE